MGFELGKQFENACRSLMASVRAQNIVPNEWVEPGLGLVPKKGGSERVIGIYDSVAKTFFSTLWADQTAQKPREYALGYVRGRRVEHAVCVQACLSWRLSRAQISHHAVLYDTRTAFFCGSHESMTARINSFAKKDDVRLLQQYHQRAG